MWKFQFVRDRGGRYENETGHNSHRFIQANVPFRSASKLYSPRFGRSHFRVNASRTNLRDRHHFVCETVGPARRPSDHPNAFGDPEYELGSVLVRFRSGSELLKHDHQSMILRETEEEIPATIETFDASSLIDGLRIVRVPGDKTWQAIKEFSARPDVQYAEPNYILRTSAVPNDTLYAANMYALNNTGQSGGTVGADIKAQQAWDITKGSSTVVVGLIDTGVDITHGDLQPNIWVNPGETPNDGIDNDGNGKIDDVNGWDFLTTIRLCSIRRALTCTEPTLRVRSERKEITVSGLSGLIGT